MTTTTDASEGFLKIAWGWAVLSFLQRFSLPLPFQFRRFYLQLVLVNSVVIFRFFNQIKLFAMTLSDKFRFAMKDYHKSAGEFPCGSYFIPRTEEI
jgi:hypothetical protein